VGRSVEAVADAGAEVGAEGDRWERGGWGGWGVRHTPHTNSRCATWRSTYQQTNYEVHYEIYKPTTGETKNPWQIRRGSPSNSLGISKSFLGMTGDFGNDSNERSRNPLLGPPPSPPPESVPILPWPSLEVRVVHRVRLLGGTRRHTPPAPPNQASL